MIFDKVKAYGFQALSLVLLVALVWMSFKYMGLKNDYADYRVKTHATFQDIAEKTAKVAVLVNKEKHEHSQQLAAQDAQRIKEVKAVRDEVSTLARDLELGNKRLRILGATCKPQPTGNLQPNAGSTSVVDGEVEYSADLRQDILILREQVRTDQVKIEGLQEFIQTTMQSQQRAYSLTMP